MSDHLMTLARRALQPSRVHPRGRTRFESETIATSSLEMAVDAVQAPAEPAAQPVARAAQPAMAQPEVPLPPAPQRQAAPSIPSETATTQAMVRSQPPAETASPRTKPSPEPAAATSPQRQVVPPEPVLTHSLERLESQRIEREVHERVELRESRLEQRQVLQQVLEQRVERIDLVQPQVYAQSVTQPLPQVAQGPGQSVAPEAAPRVEISIGRIEVLPLESAAKPRRDESPRRQPAQSLETYLQERNGASNGRGGRG